MAATGPGVALTVQTNDLLEMRLVTTFGSQTAFNVRHYTMTAGTSGSTTLGQCATALDSAFRALYRAVLSAGANWRGTMVRRILPIPPSPPAWDVTNAGAGLVAGDTIPGQCCGVISLITAFAGRAFRGRVYVAFPSETDNQATGIPSAGYSTNLTSLANQFATSLTLVGTGAITLTPGLFHRTTLTASPIVGAIGRGFWGTQRRRGGFGRTNPSPI